MAELPAGLKPTRFQLYMVDASPTAELTMPMRMNPRACLPRPGDSNSDKYGIAGGFPLPEAFLAPKAGIGGMEDTPFGGIPLATMQGVEIALMESSTPCAWQV